MFPEAKPRETSTVEGPQNILLSQGLSNMYKKDYLLPDMAP